jgi:hypothetical protein
VNGGFWQSMGKLDRLKYIEINGEPVIEIDYGQMMPRLVYSRAGVLPAMDDLYAIPGIKADRTGIKRVMSSMLFVDKPMTRFPKGTRKHFPKNVRVTDVTEAIMAMHPALVPYFFTGIGHRCQYRESQIMVEVLRLIFGIKSEGIIALPIHDAILVPISGERIAKSVMRHTFWTKTGQDAVLDVLTLQALEQTLAEAA